MIINAENLGFLNQRLMTDFQVGFDAYQPVWQDIALRVPSNGAFNTYGWMSSYPKWREWIGHRIFKHIAPRAYALINKDWEVSIEILRNVVEDDQFGFYSQIVNGMGAQGSALWDQLIAEALMKGNTTDGYDGQYFFDTDHPVDLDSASAGTYSNVLTAKPLTVDNVALGRRTMAGFKDENGNFRRIRPNLVVVPPSLEQPANEAVAAQYAMPIKNVAGDQNVGGIAMPNPNAGMRVVVLEELEAQPTVWYLMDTRIIKPIVLQVRKEPNVVTRVEEWMDNVFHRKTFEFGADARGAAGYAFPFTALRVSTV
jgi:phage major head subunit gpT-like protein